MQTRDFKIVILVKKKLEFAYLSCEIVLYITSQAIYSFNLMEVINAAHLKTTGQVHNTRQRSAKWERGRREVTERKRGGGFQEELEEF